MSQLDPGHAQHGGAPQYHGFAWKNPSVNRLKAVFYLEPRLMHAQVTAQSAHHRAVQALLAFAAAQNACGDCVASLLNPWFFRRKNDMCNLPGMTLETCFDTQESPVGVITQPTQPRVATGLPQQPRQ